MAAEPASESEFDVDVISTITNLSGLYLLEEHQVLRVICWIDQWRFGYPYILLDYFLFVWRVLGFFFILRRTPVMISWIPVWRFSAFGIDTKGGLSIGKKREVCASFMTGR